MSSKLIMRTPSSRPIVSPFLILSFGLLAVSTASILIRFAQQDVPSLVIAAYRMVLATIVLAPIAVTRHKTELRRLTRKDLILACTSGLFLALHFATWITSLEYTTVASSVIFVTTTPLWVALFSPLFLKEPLPRLALVGMGIALMGSMIVGLSDSCRLSAAGLACPSLADFLQGKTFLGNFLALVGAWTAAGYLMIGRRLRAKMSLVGYIFIVYGIAACILVGIMLVGGRKPIGYPPQAYLLMLLLALVPQLLGHTSYNWALQYLSAAYVAVVTLGEPVGAIILAYFLLQEVPPALKIFGAILTLVGIYLASRREKL
ncbi:MAG: DMT family transporter [Anaerolineales bacterium]|nr:DMT family transporter [Anaerolineales bacterium]